MSTNFLRHLRTPAVVLSALFCLSTYAFTGNELANYLATNKQINEGKRGDAFDSALSIGYIEGVGDSLKAADAICPPTGSTRGQGMDVVRKYLDSHPESRHLNGAVIVTAALKSAFPCKN